MAEGHLVQVDTSDFSDDEHCAYLIATGILPGMSHCTNFSKPSGSQHGKRANLPRDFDDAIRRLRDDYFSVSFRYTEVDFERRFRMPRSIFNRLLQGITGRGIFIRRKDKLQKPGLYPLQRIVAALRIMAYGTAAEGLDEYLQISEDSVLLSLKEFCREVVAVFGKEYLREPTEQDLKRIMSINAARGFPGCVGSIDCQHWEWKNCPIAWAGQYKGKEKKPTIVLEAICDGELWIWHTFFGSAGTLNDMNILDRSTTTQKIVAGEFPPSISYSINGKHRSLPYYLADGIYPDWAIFVKTVKEGSTKKQTTFAAAQEGFRKDIERAFGVLVARFHILQRPSRFWYREDIANVLHACIVLHNMIVEHRRDNYSSGMSSLQFFDEATS